MDVSFSLFVHIFEDQRINFRCDLFNIVDEDYFQYRLNFGY